MTFLNYSCDWLVLFLYPTGCLNYILRSVVNCCWISARLRLSNKLEPPFWKPQCILKIDLQLRVSIFAHVSYIVQKPVIPPLEFAPAIKPHLHWSDFVLPTPPPPLHPINIYILLKVKVPVPIPCWIPPTRENKIMSSCCFSLASQS